LRIKHKVGSQMYVAQFYVCVDILDQIKFFVSLKTKIWVLMFNFWIDYFPISFKKTRNILVDFKAVVISVTWSVKTPCIFKFILKNLHIQVYFLAKLQDFEVCTLHNYGAAEAQR